MRILLVGSEMPPSHAGHAFDHAGHVFFNKVLKRVLIVETISMGLHLSRADELHSARLAQQIENSRRWPAGHQGVRINQIFTAGPNL